MIRKWDAGEALNIIERERVTRFTGVPTMMRDLLEHPEFSPERTASLKSTIAGGAPVPPAQVRCYLWMSHRLVVSSCHSFRVRWLKCERNPGQSRPDKDMA